MPTVQPVISTPDLERSLEFYTRLFNAERTLQVPPEGSAFYLRLQIGDSDIGLVVDDGAPLESPQRMLLSIDVDDVDRYLENVSAAGGRVVAAAKDMPWGQRVAHIHDPDGNTINLTEPSRNRQ